MKENKIVKFLIFIVAFSNLYSNEWFTTGEFQRLNLENNQYLSKYVICYKDTTLIRVGYNSKEYSQNDTFKFKVQKIRISDGKYLIDTHYKVKTSTGKYNDSYPPVSMSFNLSTDGISFVSRYDNMFDGDAVVTSINTGGNLRKLKFTIYQPAEDEYRWDYSNFDFISQRAALFYDYYKLTIYEPWGGGSNQKTETFETFNITSKSNKYLGYLYTEKHRSADSPKEKIIGPSYLITSYNQELKKTETNCNIYLNPKLLEPIMFNISGDSILDIISLTKNNTYCYFNYDINKNQYRLKNYIDSSKKIESNPYSTFRIMNLKDIYVKQDSNRFVFFSKNSHVPVKTIIFDDTLKYLKNMKLSPDETFFYIINKYNQLIKYENPFLSENIHSFFTVADSILVANRENKLYNYSSGSPEKYIWDFGDGEQSNEFEPKHEYKLPGKYKISLKVIKGEKEDISYKEIVVAPAFNVSFEVSDSTKSIPIIYTFKNTSSGKIDSLKWDFGDGTFSNSKDKFIKHYYSKEGE